MWFTFRHRFPPQTKVSFFTAISFSITHVFSFRFQAIPHSFLDFSSSNCLFFLPGTHFQYWSSRFPLLITLNPLLICLSACLLLTTCRNHPIFSPLNSSNFSIFLSAPFQPITSKFTPSRSIFPLSTPKSQPTSSQLPGRFFLLCSGEPAGQSSAGTHDVLSHPCFSSVARLENEHRSSFDCRHWE